MVLIEVCVWRRSVQEKNVVNFSVFTKDGDDVVESNNQLEQKDDEFSSEDASPAIKAIVEDTASSDSKKKKRRRKADRLSDRRNRSSELSFE